MLIAKFFIGGSQRGGGFGRPAKGGSQCGRLAKGAKKFGQPVRVGRKVVDNPLGGAKKFWTWSIFPKTRLFMFFGCFGNFSFFG